MSRGLFRRRSLPCTTRFMRATNEAVTHESHVTANEDLTDLAHPDLVQLICPILGRARANKFVGEIANMVTRLMGFVSKTFPAAARPILFQPSKFDVSRCQRRLLGHDPKFTPKRYSWTSPLIMVGSIGDGKGDEGESQFRIQNSVARYSTFFLLRGNQPRGRPDFQAHARENSPGGGGLHGDPPLLSEFRVTQMYTVVLPCA